MNLKKCIFLVGTEHIDSFSEKIKANSINFKIVTQNWEPKLDASADPMRALIPKLFRWQPSRETLATFVAGIVLGLSW
jgi:hypothetical protein